MVKRLAFLLLFLTVLVWSRPAAAQDFSRLDLTFGYGNYGVNDRNQAGTGPESRRVNGFVMQTDMNLVRWLGFEYALGAYSQNNSVMLLTNTFGAKLVARDVVGGRLSPYVAAGAGVASFRTDRYSLGSTSALRYAVGIDLNMSPGLALRFDVGKLRLGNNLGQAGGQSDTNVTVGVVISLGQ